MLKSERDKLRELSESGFADDIKVDITMGELRALNDCVDRLEADKQKLIEAVKFYASTSMWNATTYESTRDGVCCSDFETFKSVTMGPSQVGGKRARQALKEVEGAE